MGFFSHSGLPSLKHEIHKLSKPRACPFPDAPWIWVIGVNVDQYLMENMGFGGGQGKWCLQVAWAPVPGLPGVFVGRMNGT